MEGHISAGAMRAKRIIKNKTPERGWQRAEHCGGWKVSQGFMLLFPLLAASLLVLEDRQEKQAFFFISADGAEAVGSENPIVEKDASQQLIDSLILVNPTDNNPNSKRRAATDSMVVTNLTKREGYLNVTYVSCPLSGLDASECLAKIRELYERPAREKKLVVQVLHEKLLPFDENLAVLSQLPKVDEYFVRCMSPDGIDVFSDVPGKCRGGTASKDPDVGQFRVKFPRVDFHSDTAVKRCSGKSNFTISGNVSLLDAAGYPVADNLPTQKLWFGPDGIVVTNNPSQKARKFHSKSNELADRWLTVTPKSDKPFTVRCKRLTFELSGKIILHHDVVTVEYPYRPILVELPGDTIMIKLQQSALWNKLRRTDGRHGEHVVYNDGGGISSVVNGYTCSLDSHGADHCVTHLPENLDSAKSLIFVKAESTELLASFTKSLMKGRPNVKVTDLHYALVPTARDPFSPANRDQFGAERERTDSLSVWNSFYLLPAAFWKISGRNEIGSPYSGRSSYDELDCYLSLTIQYNTEDWTFVPSDGSLALSEEDTLEIRMTLTMTQGWKVSNIDSPGKRQYSFESFSLLRRKKSSQESAFIYCGNEQFKVGKNTEEVYLKSIQIPSQHFRTNNYALATAGGNPEERGR